MVGYSVLSATLRAASTVVRAAGETAASVDLASAARGIGTALPGTVVVPAAEKLAMAWGVAITDWQSGITEHSDRLRNSADTYDAADAAATTELHGAGGDR
ncbi:MAG: hypothetical protein ACRDTG_26715 [Pseudonocardiaceae bacterium]